MAPRAGARAWQVQGPSLVLKNNIGYCKYYWVLPLIAPKYPEAQVQALPPSSVGCSLL